MTGGRVTGGRVTGGRVTGGRVTGGHVAVVGAGFGGLAAALALATAGVPVTVYEAAAEPGGKARTRPSAAGRVAAGPTVFTMRGVYDELFAAAGTRLDEHVRLVPAEVLARHVWPDGTRLDLHAELGASEAAVRAFAGPTEAERFRDFTARARRLFEAFEGPVMRHPGPSPLSVGRAVWRDGPGLLRAMGPFATLWGSVGRQFRDPRLRQLFGRYATYVGGSPMRSPGLLALIWWAEAAGVWQIEGGMSALARVLAELAAARGAELRFGTPVREIRVAGGRVRELVTDAGAEPVEAVVFNGDPAALGAGLLGPGAARVAPALGPGERSLSAWVWTFAGRPEGVELAHHTVFFSADYEAEFAKIEAGRLPADPTVYVCAQDRGMGRPVPAPERLMLIVNAPANGDRGEPNGEEIETCRMRTFGRLAASGLRLEAPEPSAETLTTPADFARAFPGTGGAIYGRAPHGVTATFRRPAVRTAVAGLYLAGGGAHPGPGVAMSGLSGRLAAEAILADRAST